jgi:hypothetical protein
MLKGTMLRGIGEGDKDDIEVKHNVLINNELINKFIF